jgi:hypothetical protein
MAITDWLGPGSFYKPLATWRQSPDTLLQPRFT